MKYLFLALIIGEEADKAFGAMCPHNSKQDRGNIVLTIMTTLIVNQSCVWLVIKYDVNDKDISIRYLLMNKFNSYLVPLLGNEDPEVNET